MHQNSELQIELEKALQRLAKKWGKTVTTAIHPILLDNLERGRISKWLGTSKNRTVQDYVERVATFHARYQDYFYQIQVEKSEEVWQDLYCRLQEWAYNYLLGKGFYRNQSTSQLAATYATEAAIVLLTARFSYDTEFDPWAHVLLLHVCRRQIRQTRKASHVPDEKKTGLEDELAHLHNPSSLHNGHTWELRHALLDAIERLPQETWQQVLLLRYFHNLTPAEIAEEMGKTASAVYNLHFKAMAALREIWDQKGDKDE